MFLTGNGSVIKAECGQRLIQKQKKKCLLKQLNLLETTFFMEKQ